LPELPDITLYIDALNERVMHATLKEVLLSSPFLLRTVSPPLEDFKNLSLIEIRRLGKRICLRFEDDHWMVIHLMIAGRFQWQPQKTEYPKARKRNLKSLASFVFSTGTLVVTEAGSKRRASLHCFNSESGVQSQDRGGLELFDITPQQFRERLQIRNRTLKRALSDPALFSGIGNAYSDEILHHARLSPIRQSQKMDNSEIDSLFESCQTVLSNWIDVLKKLNDQQFPVKVTAFREGMAVHGRYQLPCPECNTLIQRVRFANNETNYCPRCQTGGKLLADRSLSRLLKADWPKSIDELEEQQVLDTKPNSI